MIVVDASVVLEALVGGGAATARLVGEDLVAPHLVDAEVAHVLRRRAHRGDLPADRAETALQHLQSLGMQRYPHTPLLTRVWQLRHTVTAYDAMYVALAEQLDAPLVTYDARLAGAPGVRITIEVLSAP
jgi:predicted nucleic acid-binding protein